MRIFLLILVFSILHIWGTEKQFTVNLKDPEYRDGIISTNQGGIITSPELRVQARHIVYTKNGENNHSVIAEGNLMLESGGHTYVGRRLEYDFITKTGVVYEGVTAIDLWFLGGEKIRLNRDRSFYLYNAFVTTSESKQSDWKIQSREINITPKKLLESKNVTFRFMDKPIFWIPFFKSNLKVLKDLRNLFDQSPVRYNFEWTTGLWPKLNMRYQIYSWEELDLFFRLHVRPTYGVGAALESDYHSLNNRTRFLTRSYIDHDAFYRDNNPNSPKTHYRLQGLYKTHNELKTSYFNAQYDWLSDRNMQTNFNSDKFELNTAKKTQLEMRHFQDWMIFGVNGNFRINSFQGMKQTLPESFWTPKSFKIGNTGVISQNRIKASYLDYVSSKDLERCIPDFSSSRLSINNALYRPFSYHGFSMTPIVGFNGIFYGDSQDNHSVGQAILNYQFLCDFKIKRNYPRIHHILQSYATYQGLTYPTISPDTPYIFSLQDGFNRLNLLKAGLKNLFYFKQYPLFEPNIVTDFYIYGFFAEDTFKKTIPKIQGTCTWNFPSWRIRSHFGWNIEENILDYANVGLAWTINQNFAFKTEFRHRSQFNWRKCNPDNFIMEVTRNIPSLLNSPLSDGRNTLLSRLQVKIAPQWTAQLESYIGWGRKGEPSYNIAKINLITMISTSWKLQITFSHSPAPKNKNDRLDFGLSLVKK